MVKQRRYRTMTEQLGTILIAFEVIVVFLGALALFGLKVLPPMVALGGGAIFIVLFLAGIYALRKPWGVWYVLALQIALTLTGFIHGAMFLVGGLFLALWIYCQYQGGKIDAERAPVIEAYEREMAARKEAEERGTVAE
ncbi:DUF4233 domain-containing protein [Gulosibacter molinativorax]|uniref:DUF4233 domain-containing protein n=1 Tax=Gulosibacter molinativorax TaxID=256821 RepID=A0ABT7CBJ2_9MICO|nr:DUF4233 domain-containing protein [Gulosibacter molinativorax]MDJ1372164.1 DUF4233 domain-containing protein [Gulosibacter molinativorax]QUY60965.1 Hypotetical protein [Gulosibacter molinativorax]